MVVRLGGVTAVIVDTSAMMAIVLEIPGWKPAIETLLRSDRTLMSAASLVEFRMMIDATENQELRGKADTLVAQLDVIIAPVTDKQAFLIREAFTTFGSGIRTHRSARLNFGDCFAYALAKETGEPLLFVGNDFVHTDIIFALDLQFSLPSNPAPHRPHTVSSSDIAR